MRLVFGILMLFLLSLEARAFSLLGPFDTWQTTDIGYGVNEVTEEIGGPMNIGEEYRWNVKVITYGFDPSFLNFFGRKGVDEVNKAIAVFNSLPNFSKMSSNLAEYPFDVRRSNYRADALQLRDLKSHAMSVLVEQLGLANPYNFVWTLRDKVAIPGGFSYQVVMRNLDPSTGVYSRYVNGVLYSYVILDPVPGFVTAFADAIELAVDPFALPANAVAGAVSQYAATDVLPRGDFFMGLSRDDIGGLRYLYSSKNRNIEGLLPGTLALAGGGAWSPVTGTNAIVDTALRPGIEKIIFRELKFDGGGYGGFTARTNRGIDVYIDANNRQVRQTIGRELLLPDIVFSAADLNRAVLTRTGTENWVNNAATNSPGGSGGEASISGGPGIIAPPIVVTFNKVGPSQINQYSDNSFFLEEGDGSPFFLWGSFDGSTNTPFIYPVDLHGNSYPIEEVEQTIYGGLLIIP